MKTSHGVMWSNFLYFIELRPPACFDRCSSLELTVDIPAYECLVNVLLLYGTNYLRNLLMLDLLLVLKIVF